ncbi:YopX family protein [uncultured Anaerococcus sp.]|uniref:YopX family protein n=1 Tax=uncultured Anaerococcus sp. TaxID=293428 RepID=UPI00263072FC|nr:YopX family protein [uncultured Anaerococcus sp.]
MLVDFNGDEDLETIFLTNDIKLMQYSGLKDKNGREIYDGDICRWTDPEAFEGEIISDTFIARYSDEYLKWIGENNNSYHDLYDFTDDRGLELIGNIYENPELLEEVEE